MLTHENIVVSAQNGNKFDGFDGRRHPARLSADGLGRRSHLLLRPGLCRGHVRVLPREPGDGGRGPARDRPHLFLRAAARVREPADPDHGAHGGRGLAEEAACSIISWAWPGAAARQSSTASRSAPRTGCSIGWATCSSMRRSGTAWASRASRVAYTAGEAIGPELFQLLPLARHQPEAALRPDRGQRLHHAAARRRGLSRHRRQAGPERRYQDRRHRRGAVQEPRRVPQVLQERRGDRAPPRRPTAGCTPAMPASSTSAGTSRSSIAPRTWAASTTARCSRRNTSRTASSSIPRCGRRSPSARAATTSPCCINIDLDLGRQLGRAQQRVLRQLPGARRPRPGLRHDRQAGRRAEQGAGRRAADGGLADPPLPHPAQGARRRRRRADPHAESAPHLHRRSLRPAHRGALRRLQGCATSPPR